MEFNKNLIFVTGKGGTGKSLISCVLAILHAKSGKKVLLVDSESTGDVARYFEHSEIGYSEIEVVDNIFVTQCNTDDALGEYLKLNAKIPTWAKLTPLARLIDLVSHGAPGVKEILIAGKIAYETKRIIDGESNYDVVIVDAPSSGHVISLLDAPRALGEVITKGMIQTQTEWMQEIFSSDKCGVYVVTTMESIVVTETKELLSNIENNTNVDIAGVILNKDISTEHELDRDEDYGVLFSILPDEIRDYYRSQEQDVEKILTDFNQYKCFSFPLLNDMQISIRTLNKSAHRLIQLETKSAK